MTKKVIHVGVGLFGSRWCTTWLEPNIADKTVEIIAVVDIDPKALEFGRTVLKLPKERAYTDPRKAFAAHAREADFCTVVVPPNHHEAIVDLAIEFGIDILSEKPIADTMAGSARIAKKVKAAGRKMASVEEVAQEQQRHRRVEKVVAGEGAQRPSLPRGDAQERF